MPQSVVALEVFHMLMFSLNRRQRTLHDWVTSNQYLLLSISEAPQNMNDKSSTAETSHEPMVPYKAAAAVELEHQASRAVSSAARSVKMAGCGGGAGEGGGSPTDCRRRQAGLGSI
jgi:hypothetical protein